MLFLFPRERLIGFFIWFFFFLEKKRKREDTVCCMRMKKWAVNLRLKVLKLVVRIGKSNVCVGRGLIA